MSNFKKHPDGYKSYLGRDDKGLYSVRIKWAIYAANANGSKLGGSTRVELSNELYEKYKEKIQALF